MVLPKRICYYCWGKPWNGWRSFSKSLSEAWLGSNLARTAFLSKGDNDLDPKGHRGLSILSVCYRLWGVATLQRLQGWVASWEDDAIFAGTSQAVGAEDAWYLCGVQLENAKLRGDHTTGGSTDIFK